MDESQKAESENKVAHPDADIDLSAAAPESVFDILAQETDAAWKEQEVERDSSTEFGMDDPSLRPVKVVCHNCQQKLDVTKLRPFSSIKCPVCHANLIVPKWFDTFLLEEPAGFGGMATVYRALDIALDREVAIKILKPACARDKTLTESFLNEARMAATINHTSVIPIYTCGMFEDQTYLVMQYLSGGTLEQKLDQAKDHLLPIEQVLQWIRDIAEGLEDAASHGIIHHDIKPGNILLDDAGNAKIGDFGLAQKEINSKTEEETEDSTWVTPYYVSPERIMSGKEDVRGDIYSLGATFYHLLTGKMPFDHKNIEELVWMRTRQNPTPPNCIRPEIPQLISVLIMRMMNIQPEMRPGYSEIIAPLDTILNNADTASLIVNKEYPLPKKDGDMDSRASSNNKFRIKAPSAILKSYRSTVQYNLPGKNVTAMAVKPTSAKPKEPVQKTNEQKPKTTRYLLILILLFSVLGIIALVYGVMQLLQALYLTS